MTKEEYADYEEAFAAWIEGVKFPSSGYCPGCTECPEPLYDGDYAFVEPSFSWHACEICGNHFGGDRYPVHTVDINGDIIHWDACCDCVYYLEYGQLDDMTMLEIEEEV
jgi:hypothetical protein